MCEKNSFFFKMHCYLVSPATVFHCEVLTVQMQYVSPTAFSRSPYFSGSHLVTLREELPLMLKAVPTGRGVAPTWPALSALCKCSACGRTLAIGKA